MKKTTLLVLMLALMLVFAACTGQIETPDADPPAETENQNGNTETDGETGTGGDTGNGSDTETGGDNGTGGNPCEDCGKDPCVCFELSKEPWNGVWLGKGTENDPLQVSKAAQLAEIARLVNLGELETAILGDGNSTVYIKLMNNIDLSGYTEGAGWTPIGKYDNPQYYNINNPRLAFNGVFDGNNKTVTGLYINDQELRGAGLFGCINGGTVKNLRVEGANVTDSVHTGGVADYVYNGSLENCSVKGKVGGRQFVGGVLGYAKRSSLENCYAVGEVSDIGTKVFALASSVGGVAGCVDYGSLENCYFTGSVKGGESIGGVVGEASGSLKNCYSEATVIGGDFYAGGVVGRFSEGSMENCYATGAVSGGSWVGGVVGSIFSHVVEGSVKNCYATGNVSGEVWVGGVAGLFQGNVIMENCYATGNVSGDNCVGGVAGYVSGSMKNCYATGNVSGNSNVGGVAGYVTGSGVSSSSGNILAVFNGSVENCYATGNVSGNSNVGGVVGMIHGFFYEGYFYIGSVENCAALNPSVTGNSSVGRVAGQVTNRTPSGNIAFSGMTVTVNSAAKTLVKGADKLDGADISAAAILADGTLGGLFTAENGWTVQNGKLPGLGAAVNMPTHIK
ncbi:MAG: hypothetical protein FWD39_02785 [Clostridiales bacterium]|nr:hypothetical protein [Clostridiales bacterium]